MANDAKIVVSCRIEDQLKTDLQTEAIKQDLSVSSYIENILYQRNHNAQASNTIQEYRKRMLEAEVENERLKVEVVALSKENGSTNYNLAKQCGELSLDNINLRDKVVQLEKYCQQLDREKKTAVQTRPYWISETTHQRVINSIKKLKNIRPQYSEEQLLLLATEITLNNERNWFDVYKISDFLDSYPQFLTFKTPTV